MVNWFGVGGEGIIWKVVWGNCIYVMKLFLLKEGFFFIEFKVVKLRLVLYLYIV